MSSSQKFFAERERWICGEDIAPLLYSGSKHGTAVPNAGALVSCCACLPLHLSDNRKFMVWNIDLWSSFGNLPFCNPRNMCLFKFCCDGASRADFVHGSNIILWIRTWARMRELIKSTVLVRICENALMRVWTQKPEISSSKYGWWACTRKSLKTTFFCTGWMPPCAARSSTKFHEVHVPNRTKPQLARMVCVYIYGK